MLLAEGGVPLDTWKAQFDANAVAADFDRFMEHVRVDYLPHPVIIDCTASADIAKRYPDWLAAGIHIVTPNKKANSADMPFYRRLRAARRTGSAHYLYEAPGGGGFAVRAAPPGLRRTGCANQTLRGNFFRKAA